MTVFSCDLVEESRNHVRFLEGLHADGVMLTPVSPTSLDRYLNNWLTFVAHEIAESETVQLIPPPDVAWIWHCHRLAPMNYERYIRKRFGTLLEAFPSFSFQREEDTDTDALLTRDAWYRAFPNDPFFLEKTDDCESSSSSIIQKCQSLEGFDLVGSTQNQAAFLWQVSGPKFRQDEFLHEAVENYHKFLKLFSTGEKRMPLVPTYQIDLMWHTHILTSLRAYQEDCIAIRGEKFHHDDSLNDRAPGATLDLAFQSTKKLWEETYNDDYIVEGGMYRGEPPSVYYDVPAWEALRALERSIAVAAGASLTGTSEPQSWIDPRSFYLPSRNAFMPATARSRDWFRNNNEKKNGYIFGKGAAGNGYYSLDTRDAYTILYKRLSRQEAYAQQCSIFRWFLPAAQLERWEEEVRNIRAMKDYVKARSEASSPGAPITLDCHHRAYSVGDLCEAGGCGGGPPAHAAGCG
jgi:hypothetical protein